MIEVKIGTKFFKALVDSGSSQTLVITECLSELNTLIQDKLEVRRIHGDGKRIPQN